MVSRLDAAVAEINLVYQEREANEGNDEEDCYSCYEIGDSASAVGTGSKAASEVGGMEVDTEEFQ